MIVTGVEEKKDAGVSTESRRQVEVGDINAG